MADLARYVVRYPFPTSPIKNWAILMSVTSSDIMPHHFTFGKFAEEAIMAAEGEEGPRLGTTHPYLGPFVRYFYKQITTQERVGYLPLRY